MPWVVSGKSEAALRDQARRLAQWVQETGELDPVEVGRSLIAHRSVFDHRAVVFGEDTAGLCTALTTLADGNPARRIACGQNVHGKIAVLLTGQGAQRIGMGRQLYEHFPVFAAALDAIAAEFDQHLDRSLLETMWSGEHLDETLFTQCALFAFEASLYRLTESFGVHADVLIGHSIGEITAAHLAGTLTLRDAATLVIARGRLLQALPSGGAMATVQASETEVQQVLDEHATPAVIAAVNSPVSIVIAGLEHDLATIEEVFRTRGRRVKRLRVDRAFHSPLVDPILDEFESVARTIRYQAPQIQVISTVTGRTCTENEIRSPEYWVQNVRRPVKFAAAIRTAAQAGARTFYEVGPGQALSVLAGECVEDASEVAGFAALANSRDEVPSLLTGLSELFVRGVGVDWPVLLGAGSGLIDLPTYAFQRQRFWLESAGTHT
ncbi:acyltransferase domain-containing protein, partial [Nocardia abscessus]|uniref:acyltransferase domain-containing protein n=1 Tax=Nocardia abscessus TaxID=120957 RepID=UPI0024565F60